MFELRRLIVLQILFQKYQRRSRRWIANHYGHYARHLASD